ncbi:S8 family peptidase [Algoriphagus antarcticus]|uniref:Subtilase family protein n=1 Tax=Algoriphagus antarcticus TaxID=238540 RepID=A0A3E0E3A7_9BACT|nr:S8 family serine peptidase [Algoriphagus antarcticus]REG92764.1 subtilase family protein [Algoriphagus antarcticus]
MNNQNNNRIYGLIFIALFVVSCSSEEQPSISQTELSESKTEVIPSSEIDQIILKSLQESGDFVWGNQSNELILSALIQSDSILTIGYQASGQQLTNARIGLESVQVPEMQEAAGKIIGMISEIQSRNQGANLRKIEESLIHADLPFLELKVYDLEALETLKKMGEVRYFEPRGYEFDYSLLNDEQNARLTSGSGCENEPESVPVADYSVTSPNAKASWNYVQMGISQAWAQSTGAGITVGVIDTGLSPDQPALNGFFNSGESSNRIVQRFGTYKTGYWWWKKYDGPNDQCGHGTAMAGVVASPRNAVGNAVGVAYNSNLISVRGTSDVIFDSGNEKDGVAEALVLLGKRSDVKIISMSIGDLFSNSKVADAIRYAHNRGKLIFAAAGTSTTFTNWIGVIFPATMSETVAVTGVKEGNGYQRCDTCHSGAKVEFTVIMERTGSNTKPLTTALYSNDPSTVGGSSVATATAAGIAALVWAKNPGWTREQVVEKMRSTSDLFPSRNSEYGYGNLNAAAAVGFY